MSHFKAPDNALHRLDDDRFEYLLPPGSVKITDEEADAIRAEQAAAEQLAVREGPTPAVDLVDQVLADPAALARLKAALGVS